MEDGGGVSVDEDGGCVSADGILLWNDLLSTAKRIARGDGSEY